MLKTSQKGQSLIEVVVALGFIILIGSAFISLGINSVKNSVASRNQQAAEKLAQQGMEQVIIARDDPTQTINGESWATAFAALTCNYTAGSDSPATVYTTTGCHEINYNPPTSPVTGVNFYRRIRFYNQTGGSDDPNQIKSVVVIVTWTDGVGTHSTSVVRKVGKDRLQ